MYTSYIGKRFVEIYNRKMKTDHTPESFFDTVYYDLFYDSDKFLFSPGNTPIFQLMASKKSHISEERIAARNKIKQKAEDYVHSHALQPDMSFAIGYGSSDDLGTTSGQISSIKMSLLADDVYASWIGAGLGIGIGGGQNLLIDHEDILWAIYEGWNVYRKFVNQTDGINNKIETWNGVWLKHRFSIAFNPQFPDSFRPVSVNNKGEAQMERPTWIEIFSMLSLRFGGTHLTAYVYQFSQTNTTVGFIQINLPEIKRLYEIYPVLFPESGIEPEELMKHFETAYGFITVCQAGIIGLKQLEPKDLRKYMSGGEKIPNEKNYEKSPITFTIYLSWIIAMLNNKEFLDLAVSTAKVLQTYAAGGGAGRKTRSNDIDELLKKKAKKDFIADLIPIMQNEPDIAEQLNDVANALHLDVPQDNVGYFITLLRFKYYLPINVLNS